MPRLWGDRPDDVLILPLLRVTSHNGVVRMYRNDDQCGRPGNYRPRNSKQIILVSVIPSDSWIPPNDGC